MLTIKSDKDIVCHARYRNADDVEFSILFYGDSKEVVDWAAEYFSTGLQFGPNVLIWLLAEIKKQGVQAVMTLDPVSLKDKENESANL